MRKLRLLTNKYDLKDLIDEFYENPDSSLFKKLKFTKYDYMDLYYETVAVNPGKAVLGKVKHEEPFMTDIPYPLVRVDKRYCNFFGLDADDLDYDQMLYNPASHKFIQYSNRFGSIVTTEIPAPTYPNGTIVKNARYRSHIKFYNDVIKNLKSNARKIKSSNGITPQIKSEILSIDPTLGRKISDKISVADNIKLVKDRIQLYNKLLNKKSEKNGSGCLNDFLAESDRSVYQDAFDIVNNF